MDKYTILEDRKLFFDGTSVFDPVNIIKLNKKYDVKYVDYITDQIKQYNLLCDISYKINQKTECEKFKIEWNIPEQYKNLNVIDYIFDKHTILINEYSLSEKSNREIRLADELSLFVQMGHVPILRLMIYIIESLNKQDIVYGVGRGSSVSSYVLFVIGVHDVDSYKYDLNIHDFLHL